MLTFVSEAMMFASPLFHEMVADVGDITPAIETTTDELRLTMYGRKRNGRDVGIRIYQFGTITRLITTLDPIERADTSATLLPPLRYAATPEWLTMRAEATGFEYGPEHFEAVLSQFLAQVLETVPRAPAPVDVHELRRHLPGAQVTAHGVRIDTRDLGRAAAAVDVSVLDGWVRARTPVVDAVTTAHARLRLNDHAMFFRSEQRADTLVLEGELPGDLIDADSLEWLAVQITMTAAEVRAHVLANGIPGSDADRMIRDGSGQRSSRGRDAASWGAE